MNWKIINNIDWNQKLKIFEINSYYNLNEYGQIKNKEKWKVVKLAYIKNEKMISATQILYKKFLGIFVFFLPGGFEGNTNAIIIDDLKTYLTKQFNNRFIIVIDFYKNFSCNFDNLSFYKFNSQSNETLIKNLQTQNVDLLSTYSKNFKRNVERSKRYNIKISIIKKPNIKEQYDLYYEMVKFKKINNFYSYKKFICFYKYFEKSIICFEARKDNKLIGYRTFIKNINIGWDLFATSNYIGKKMYVNYALLNKVFEFCLQNKIAKFDLSGIDREQNKNVYNFKKGTGSEHLMRPGRYYHSSNILINLILKFFLYNKKYFT